MEEGGSREAIGQEVKKLWAGVERALSATEAGVGGLKEVEAHLKRSAGIHTETAKAYAKQSRAKLSKAAGLEVGSTSDQIEIAVAGVAGEVERAVDAYGEDESWSPLFRVLAVEAGVMIGWHEGVAGAYERVAADIATAIKVHAKGLAEVTRGVRRDQSELDELLGSVDAARQVVVDRAEAVARAAEVVHGATGDPSVPPDKYAAMERKLAKAQLKKVEAEGAYGAAVVVFNTMKKTILGVRRVEALDQMGGWAMARSALVSRAIATISDVTYAAPSPADVGRPIFAALGARVDIDRDVQAMLASALYDRPLPPDLEQDGIECDAADVGGTSIVHASFDFEHEFLALLGVSFSVEKAKRRADRAARWAARGVDSPFAIPLAPPPDDASPARLSVRPSASTRRHSLLAAVGDKPLPSLPPLPPLPEAPARRPPAASPAARRPSLPTAAMSGGSLSLPVSPAISPHSSPPTSPRPKKTPPPKPARRKSTSAAGLGLPPPKPPKV